MTASDSLELSKILAKQRDEFHLVKKHVEASAWTCNWLMSSESLAANEW